MKHSIAGSFCAGLFILCVTSTSTHAATITFDDLTLGTGTSFTQSGITLNVSASSGGTLDNITSGQYAGLWIAQDVSDSGTYTFTFSEAISAIEIQFDALSGDPTDPPSETISGFSTSAGAPVIAYTNIAGTSFDGNSILSTTGPFDSNFGDGRGFFNASLSSSFTSFSFDHAQGLSQNGFVIERISVTTLSTIPIPAAAWLFGSGLLGLIGVARRKKT